MSKITRWDTGETIHEHDGDIKSTVEAAAKLGISCFRANLDGANLDRASLVGASLVGASLVGASLVGASLVGANLDGVNLVRANLDGVNLVRANLDGANLVRASLVGANLDGVNLVRANLDGVNLVRANLDGANLDGANLPIWCKWSVTWTRDGSGSVSVHIGCKSKLVTEWDTWFSGNETYDTDRDTDDFRRIHANYLAVRAYLVAMGIHAEQVEK